MTDGKTAWGNSAIRNQGARFKEKMLAQGPWRMFKKSGPGPVKHHAPLAAISRDKRIFLTVPTLSIPSISGSAVSL